MKLTRSWTVFSVACALTMSPAFATDDPALALELAALVRETTASDASAVAAAPGGVIGILRRGEPIAVHAFGLADLESKHSVTADTAFYIASTAKQFTAACIAHAAAAGRLSLDDSVTKYVSGLPDTYRPVTLRHLMHHRSGVKDIYETSIALDLGRDALVSNTAAVGVLRRLTGLDFVPGERCTYSNSGYVLLAESLRSATGSTLAAYAREHIFRPLKMDHAHFTGESAEQGGESARSYRSDGDSFEPLELATDLIGPGGMWASFTDFARWDLAWATQKFASSTVREILLAPPKLAGKQSLHPVFGPYAGGLMVGTWRGQRTVRHAGGAFGFSAEFMRFPEHGISVVVLSSNGQIDARRLAESAAEIALRDKLTAEAAPNAPAGSPDELARYGRMWLDERSGIVWIVTLKAERKVVATLGDVKLDVAIASPTRLVSAKTQVPVTLDFEPAEGNATRMTARFGDVEVASCRPIAFPPRDLPPASDYEGAYRMRGIDSGLELRAEGDKLTLVQNNAILPVPPFVLPPFQPIGEELFICDAGWQLRFTRDETGMVTGGRLDSSRARGFMFERQ